MSPRRDVSRERIEEVLRAVGAAFHHRCRLYLAGGDGLVWRGLRRFTHDIDISYYAVALGKLGRGHDQDIADIRSMLAAGVIAADALRRHFEAILPEYERRGFRADPVRFRAMLELALGPET